MVDQDIPKYAALLKQQYLFQGLNEAQLAHVVNRFERMDVAAGAVLIEQGAAGDTFYVLFKGRVQVSRRKGARERILDTLGPGDYFGEEALLFERPRSASIVALEPVVLLWLDRDSFFDLIDEFPDMRLNLSATAESRFLAHRENFPWLGEDEVIYLISRKHEFFLLTMLILPILLGISSIPAIVWGFAMESAIASNTALIGGSIGLAAAVLWGVWNWVDWGNDFYIVTNRRTVWLERVIFLYYSRREAPLTQVLSVNVKTSWLGRVLGYGNVDVRTYTGSILMRNCNNPLRFASYIEGFQTRAKHLMKLVEAETIEKELRQRLSMDPLAETVKTELPKKPKADADKKKKPETMRDILATFLRMRYERDGEITYRKHWLVLLGKTWQPLLVLLLFVGFSIWLVYSGSLQGASIVSGVTLVLFLLLVILAIFTWWGYNYLDWNNDIYRLTSDQILDIERRPLGDENKKTAPLDSILSLEHSREGIIQLIFNYGNVIISVGQTQFIFRGVHNPDQVHQDVADRIETRRRKKQETDATRERERLADWFSSYRKQTKIIEESQNDSDWDIFPG